MAWSPEPKSRATGGRVRRGPARTTIALALVLICVLATLTVLTLRANRRVWRDANGSVRGTGTLVYRYPDGAVRLREEYVSARLELSRWYAPDGSLVHETAWQDGSGVGVHLRDDGSIRDRMTYVHGIAEGTATYYAADGRVEREVEFRNGSPVGSPESSPSLLEPDEPAPPASAPDVPPHPRRNDYLGRWVDDTGRVVLEVRQHDGRVRIVEVSDEVWRTVITNVRWKGDALRFDTYSYLQPGAPASSHPFEGVRVTTTLRLGKAADRLHVSAESKQTDQPIESDLTRESG